MKRLDHYKGKLNVYTCRYILAIKYIASTSFIIIVLQVDPTVY